MDSYFICPYCKGHLLVEDRVIFRVRNQKKEFGLLLLSPQVGNYNSAKHPEFEYRTGEKSTYKVSGDSVMASGEDSGKYTYFSMPDNFRQFYKK